MAASSPSVVWGARSALTRGPALLRRRGMTTDQEDDQIVPAVIAQGVA